MRLSTRARLPAEVRSRLRLERGERVLAVAAAEDGSWLAGTRLALHVVGADDELRVGWQHVESAEWDADAGELVVSEVGEWRAVRPVHRFALVEPDRLLQLLRERVSASVLLQRRIGLEGGRGFVVVARRSPADGAIAWSVEYDEGIEPDVVRPLVDAALAQARGEVTP